MGSDDAPGPIGANIERRARAIAAELGSRQWESSPRGMIARELALTLEALDRAKLLYHGLNESVLEAECRIGSEILKVRNREQQDFQLQGFLMTLSAERRRLTAIKHERLSDLQTRLLVLLNKHSQLSFDDD